MALDVSVHCAVRGLFRQLQDCRALAEWNESAICAFYAVGAGRINFESGNGDLLVAAQAITIFTGIEATQGTVYSLQFKLPAALGFFCHLLSLQGVNAGQPANPCLVKRHDIRGFLVLSAQLHGLLPERKQRLPKSK